MKANYNLETDMVSSPETSNKHLACFNILAMILLLAVSLQIPQWPFWHLFPLKVLVKKSYKKSAGVHLVF